MSNSEMKQRLHDDMTAALKARDELRKSVLRMALTAVTKQEVAGKEARELSDPEVLEVLTAEAKKRRESVTAYRDAGREELAVKEQAEADILAEYLPEQLTLEEITALVTEAIATTGAADLGPRGIGKVMGALQPKVKGKADGGTVSAEVKRQLGA
ncbi:GatB/YqeY domain-containing protein [Streptomyces sp. SID13031]|uniref:GatB/YqeY domain-containing protein n=1 Tax=Streptomyces sp. SID13031 TaxID=2706046 RepID=UPI0013C7A81F|nr:GatB/YqeY domain-containing protein [Streptomyces sp. SID13031]NEA35501.1 GatB/YqeY domain-containing protein [Streptomyces sp. SID13031]